MASITSTGVASGMDFETIIQSSLQVKKAQLEKQTSLKKEETNIELSGVSKLKGALNTFKTALETLKKDTSFNVRKFTSNQDKENPFFSVTTKEDATNCKFDVEVKKLATSEKISKNFGQNWTAKKSDEGTFTIYLGKDPKTGEKVSVDAPDKNNNKDKLTAIKVEVKKGNTLEDIRKKINKNDAGLTASVIHTEQGDQLIIDSGMTGEGKLKPNPKNTDVVHTNLWISGDTSCYKFCYQPWINNPNTDGWKQTEGTQAEIEVDGSTLVSDTNTFDKQISGIDLTVHRVSDKGPNTLEVSQDIDGITKKVTDLLDAYNTLMDTMDGLYKHDTYENGKNKYDGGELAGDGQLKSLQNSLRNIMTSFHLAPSSSSSGSAANDPLDIYSLGLEVDKSGKFSLDSSKFKEGIKDNFNAVVNLFTKEADEVSGQKDPKTAGLIHRLFDIVDSYTKSDGVLSNREDQLNDRIRDYEAKEANNATYLEKYEENLRIKYSKLDITIGNANQSMSYMQSVLAGLGPVGGAMI